MRGLTLHTRKNYVLKVVSMSPKKMLRNRWKEFTTRLQVFTTRLNVFTTRLKMFTRLKV